MKAAKYDYSRSNLGPPAEADELQPTIYGYQLWENMQPDNDNFDAADLDDYEFNQDMATGNSDD